MASSKKRIKKKRAPKKSKKTPTLLIVEGLDNPCCPEGVGPVDATLKIFTDDLVAILEGPVGYDSPSNTYVLERRVVDEVFSRYDVSAPEVKAFEIDDQTIETFMCGSQGERVRWKDVIAKMREYLKPPTLRPDVATTYPQKDVTWEMKSGYAGRYSDGRIASIVFLVDQNGELVRQQVVGDTPNAGDLLQLLLQGVVYPLADEAVTGGRYVPTAVATDDDTLIAPLGDALAKLSVTVELRRADTTRADALLDLFYDAVKVPRPFLQDVSDEALHDYFAAADRYYAREHWNRVRGDKFIGVQIDDGDWHYLNLMGQEGAAPGVAFFADWIAACRLIHDQPSFFESMLLASADDAPSDDKTREAISFWTLDHLHPSDEARIRALDEHKQYGASVEFPVPLRVSTNGVQEPELGLEPYTLILGAIDTVLSRRNTPVVTSIKQTIKLSDQHGDHQVRLRYPAKGDEAFSDEAVGTYRVTIDLATLSGAKPAEDGFFGLGLSNEAGDAFAEKVVLEASGDSTAQEVVNLLHDRFDFYVTSIVIASDEGGTDNDDGNDEDDGLFSPERLFGLRDPGKRVWSQRNRHGPQPFVCQLADLASREPLAMSAWLNPFPLVFERISDSPRPKDDAVKVLEPRR
ncbi:MAG: hypothetical protein U5L04_07805 [Trueperaceae bacterium]|nr:hypothetical protein [Trueperaceae bacterium]